MDLSAVLVIAGLAFMVAGLLFLVFAPRPEEMATSHSAVTDPAELIKQVGEFLDKFEARFRVGMAVMFFGLALAGAGVYLEVNEAKNAAKDAATTAPAAAPPP